MNKLTHKLCHKCNTEYKHYGSSLTKCPRCEELKNELKGNEKGTDNISRREASSESGRKIYSIRAGKKLRKLTSENLSVQKEIQQPFQKVKAVKTKKSYRIPKTTSKQQAINNAIATLKKNRIERLGSFCEACGLAGWCAYAHVAPKSVWKKLQLDPEGGFLACPQCDTDFEHFRHPERVLKFFNLDSILEFLKEKAPKRYLHVIEILKLEEQQLNYSR